MIDYEINSPYFVLHDGLHDLEEAAVLAGQIKGAHEELESLIAALSKLGMANTTYQEDRARRLLEILIVSKRAYLATETKRLVEKTYEE